jgi:cyclin-D1-binding protein 1
LDTSDALSVNSPALPVLHKDLISLLSLVYAQITKLAICLKPASPTYSAAVSPLQEMSKHVIAIATCAALFDEDVHGTTLVQEVRSAAREVLESVDAFLKTLRNLLNSTAAPEDNQEYLVRTGAVHELIEHARGPNGLSKTNLDAVRRRWDADQDVLKDAFKEFEEMLEESTDEADEEEDEFGDGWDELGLGTQKMTDKELARAKSVRSYNFTLRLHLDIPLVDTTDPPTGYPPS